MGAPGPWAMPPPPRRPVAVARAPLASALLVLHPLLAFAFTMWAIDGLLHCDDDGATCGLGFAPHLLLPAVVGVVVVVIAGTIGLVVRPGGRLHAWLVLVAPTALTWLSVGAALAVTG